MMSIDPAKPIVTSDGKTGRVVYTERPGTMSWILALDTCAIYVGTPDGRCIHYSGGDMLTFANAEETPSGCMR